MSGVGTVTVIVIVAVVALALGFYFATKLTTNVDPYAAVKGKAADLIGDLYCKNR